MYIYILNHTMKTTFIKTFVLAVSSFVLFSCSSPAELTAEQLALKDKFAAQLGEISSLEFSSFEKIDSTTVAEEITMREKTFLIKLEQDKKFYEKYRNTRNSAKAAEKQAAMDRDLVLMRKLSEIRTALGDAVDGIAYYDYKFSAKGRADGEPFEAEGWYACITPDGRVLSLVKDQKDLHKGTGVAIPGYSEIFED